MSGAAVTEMIARQRGISARAIRPSDALVGNLLMTPTNIVDLADAIEARFSIRLAMGDEFLWRTVSDVVTAVQSRMQEMV